VGFGNVAERDTTAIGRAARLRELRPYVTQARQMQGWTFAYEPVPVRSPVPWDYISRARELAVGSERVLDLGTGGGEVFERILVGFSGRVVAGESWAPNVAVAARRLRPLGIELVHMSSLALPFAATSFDLVLDRHEALMPAEVGRVFRPGGRVLTQQVHPDYHHELREFFPRMTVFEPHDVTYPNGFQAAGLKVLDVRQHLRSVAYRQLGHLVYFLAVAPWTIPDFDLESDLDGLLEVERRLGGPEGVVLSDPGYLLEARKPA
jgi:SAM-dependent methyltransferase